MTSLVVVKASHFEDTRHLQESRERYNQSEREDEIKMNTAEIKDMLDDIGKGRK